MCFISFLPFIFFFFPLLLFALCYVFQQSFRIVASHCVALLLPIVLYVVATLHVFYQHFHYILLYIWKLFHIVCRRIYERSNVILKL